MTAEETKTTTLRHEFEHREARFSFRARPVAAWSLAFSFACLVSLVVVVAVDDNDALATVALSLAILAFALQLIFFMVQLRVAGEQDRRSADLYRSTSAVLLKIDERSAATVEVIRDQFDFVLRHALGATAPVLEEPVSVEDGDSDESGQLSEAQVEAIVNRAVRGALRPDVLATWRQISTPRAELSRVELSRQTEKRNFRADVQSLLHRTLAGRDDVELFDLGRLSTGPNFVIRAHGKEMLISALFLRPYVLEPDDLTSLVNAMSLLADLKAADEADTALLVTPFRLPPQSVPEDLADIVDTVPLADLRRFVDDWLTSSRAGNSSNPPSSRTPAA